VNRWSWVEKVFFGAFLFWSLAGLIFTLARISPATVSAWSAPEMLRSFVTGCLRIGDPALLLLAFANSHLHAARQWSAPAARRWALIVLVAALLIETIGVETGFPFGAYRYSDRFGPMLGVVPFTIPLAWHVVVTNAFFLVRAWLPRASQPLSAALTGLVGMAYDFALEPFATRAKHYWNWTDGNVPPQNYAAWFVLSALLAGLFAPGKSALRFPRDPRPAVLLLATLAIFLAGNWSR
jgi:putative membrane protein